MKYEIIPIQLQEGGKIPVYANYNDAGADVFAAEDLILRPMEKLVVPLNFSVALPDHLEMQVRPRSGLSLKTTLAIPNSPGTVDAGYRDPVGVIVENTYNIAQLPYALLYDEELRTKVQKEGKILKPDEAKAIFSTYSGSSLETPETLALFPFLVLDASTGQNALSQAQAFSESVKVSAVICTKMDGTAKGGSLIALARQLKLPVAYIGLGEKPEDLRPFDPEAYLSSITRELDDAG